jgi:hypothetical protein
MDRSQSASFAAEAVQTAHTNNPIVRKEKKVRDGYPAEKLPFVRERVADGTWFYGMPTPIESYTSKCNPGDTLDEIVNEMAAISCTHAADDHSFCHDCWAIKITQAILEGGKLWHSDARPLRRAPYRILLEHRPDWLRGGCQERVHQLVNRYTKLGLTPWTGWLLFIDEDGRSVVWEHLWATTKSGLLLDPSVGHCGVPEGWAYMGIPEGTENYDPDVDNGWEEHSRLLDVLEKAGVPIPDEYYSLPRFSRL